MNQTLIKNAYIYKWHFFWIGWIVGKYDEKQTNYLDCESYEIIASDPGIIYLTFSFSFKKVLDRVAKQMHNP